MTLLLRRASLIAGLDLALVAVGVLVDPGADGDLQPELGGDRRDQFHAAGRRVQADRLGHGGELFQVGADFLLARQVVGVGMGAALERRIGNAGQDAAEIGRGLLVLEQAPESGVGSRNEQENSDDGAHLATKPYGACILGKRTRPLGSTDTAACSKISLPRNFTTDMTPWRFKGAVVQTAFTEPPTPSGFRE